MAYQSWSVVFGEQPSAAKWNILGTNDAHFYSFLGDNLTWQSWTPTWTSVTVGNGVNASKYTQIGKTVIARIYFTLGTTSAVTGVPAFTLPVTAAAFYTNENNVGDVIFTDSGATVYNGYVQISTTTGSIWTQNVAGTYLTRSATSSTVPMTWATNDAIFAFIIYEAA